MGASGVGRMGHRLPGGFPEVFLGVKFWISANFEVRLGGRLAIIERGVRWLPIESLVCWLAEFSFA